MTYATFYQIVHWQRDGELDHSIDYTDWDDFIDALADCHGAFSAAEWIDGVPKPINVDVMVEERRADLACEARHESGLRSPEFTGRV